MALFEKQSMMDDGPERLKLVYEIDKKLQEDAARPIIANNVRFTQWRTVHAQDSAFRALEVDPQITNLYGGIVQQLPENWGELRLGHNLSIKWVCKTLYNNL